MYPKLLLVSWSTYFYLFLCHIGMDLLQLLVTILLIGGVDALEDLPIFNSRCVVNVDDDDVVNFMP